MLACRFTVSLLSPWSIAQTLRKEIAMMEEELKVRDELMKEQERLVQGWREELKDHSERHIAELERV
ncbi:MEDIATOR OF RNA polymerase II TRANSCRIPTION SUBUNIT 28 [Salix purpurea]|uniref:MEDIATOR OF RNA polymerase II TRANSCRIPTION SUBUNIT 28 n=1 Tax=Salix purpurea TaxID=77065 RepID=A0A9Q0PE60_SALPP|nr:MEDIATOR OF RNA polymerase II TRANSCRIPTION SUBUNIT 28 [Salix purpurea]